MRTKGKIIISIITSFFVLTFIASTALAATLYMQTINYQGRLADSGGAPVDGPVSMTFAIYNTPSGGSALWSETQSNVTVTDGAFSVVLGSINPITLPFDEQYYLGVQVEADAEMSPRAFLLSVPYAMRAAEVDTIAPGSVTSSEIADGAVTGAKLSVPVDLSAADSSPIIRSTNTGTGKAGEFKVDNASSSAHALSATTNGNGYAIYGSSSGTGYAIYGSNMGTGNAGSFMIGNSISANHAVFAQTLGSGNAVYGLSSGTGKAGHFKIVNAANDSFALHAETSGTGYSGYFSGGAGVYVSGNLEVTGSIAGDGSGLTGIQSTHDHDADYVNVSGDSMTGTLSVSSLAGDAVYGYTTATGGRPGHFAIDNTANANYALYVTTNGTGNAGFFLIDNTSNTFGALSAMTYGTGSAGIFQVNNTASTADALYAATTGTGWAAYLSGGKGVYVNGDLIVSGHLVKSSGTFVQPHPTDPSKELVYAFFEGPEHAVFLRGTARLVDGKAVIDTPEYFRVVAGEEGITVQFTPRSAKSKGLAAVEVSKEEIRVEELLEGKGTYEFDYFITAKRAGFEAHEPIQPNTHFSANMKTAEEFEQAYAKDDITSTAMRKLLVSNGILTADGKLNMELAKELGWVVKDSDVAVK